MALHSDTHPLPETRMTTIETKRHMASSLPWWVIDNCNGLWYIPERYAYIPNLLCSAFSLFCIQIILSYFLFYFMSGICAQ